MVSILSILLLSGAAAVTGAPAGSGALGPREGEIRSLVERLQRTKPGGVALDYRKAGTQEPPVVYVDLAIDDIVPLAPDLATFVDGLFDVDRDHHYGFAGVGEDPQPLIKAPLHLPPWDKLGDPSRD